MIGVNATHVQRRALGNICAGNELSNTEGTYHLI